MIGNQQMEVLNRLGEEEQELVISFAKTLLPSEHETEAQRWLRNARKKYITRNPMSMEEIDKIIHGEEI